MRKYKITCPNCGVNITINRANVHTEKYEIDEQELIINYVECTTCGEKILKQIDTDETWNTLTPQIVKLHRRNKTNGLSKKQTDKLRKMEQKVYKVRKNLEDRYHNEIYQSLNWDAQP